MSRGQGYWAVRTYEAGRVGEKIKFWVPGEKPAGRLTRKQKSDIRKAAQNEYSAERQLARLINANFGPGDWFLGLDYSEEGLARVLRKAGTEEMDRVREAAARELVNCIRRVKRELEREGIELRYVAITSDMDGETGEAVRVHHHLVINRAARNAFVHKWQDLGYGGVSWSPLSDQDDYWDIAVYLMKQVRSSVPMANRYTSSRNLVRPQPKDRVVSSAAEVRVPKGCRLLVRKEYRVGQAQYIRYRIE